MPRAVHSKPPKHVPVPERTAPGRLHTRVGGLALALALLTSACGSGASSTSSPPVARTTGPATFPVTVQAADGAVTIAQRPTNVVSLSPTATEMLFAIGAGAQVVAVDDQSNYPPSAPITKLSGDQPNVEAIANYSPDLVVAMSDGGGLVHGLQNLNVPVLIEPAANDLDEMYAQIDQLGMATGHLVEARAVDAKIKQQIASIVSSVPKSDRTLSVYHELDNTYYSATSHTFIGQVYTMLGLKNIADGASTKVPDYPQLSAEYIIQADPDLIVLADGKCCQQNAQTVAARPGWAKIPAVQGGEVIPVDDDIASRWGPRIVDFIRIIAEHVRAVEQSTPASSPL